MRRERGIHPIPVVGKQGVRGECLPGGGNGARGAQPRQQLRLSSARTCVCCETSGFQPPIFNSERGLASWNSSSWCCVLACCCAKLALVCQHASAACRARSPAPLVFRCAALFVQQRKQTCNMKERSTKSPAVLTSASSPVLSASRRACSMASASKAPISRSRADKAAIEVRSVQSFCSLARFSCAHPQETTTALSAPAVPQPKIVPRTLVFLASLPRALLE